MNRFTITTVIVAVLIMAMIFMPVSAASADTGNELVKNQLFGQLEKQVKTYNLAVNQHNMQKITQSVRNIDTILEKLSDMGYTVDFTPSVQTTKNSAGAEYPTTVAFNIADETATENLPGERHFTANEAQLKKYNELDIDNISTGEFLEIIFPEALQGIPDHTREFLDNTPYKELLNQEMAVSGDDFLSESSAESLFLPIVVHPESYFSANSGTVRFSSDSRVWFPHPWYAIPYMSVASELRKDNGICYALDYKEGYNVYYIKAGFSYNVLSSGNYQTHGGHIAEVGPEYFPPVQTFFTETEWSYVART